MTEHSKRRGEHTESSVADNASKNKIVSQQQPFSPAYIWSPNTTEAQKRAQKPHVLTRTEASFDDVKSDNMSSSQSRYLVEWQRKKQRQPKPSPKLEIISKIKMKRSVLRSIEKTIGSRPPESGGILLGSVDDYVVTEFIFDDSAETSYGTYVPNTEFLNSQLVGKEDRFIGIVHSHPSRSRRLSEQDLRAAWSNLTSPSNPHLNAYLMPIVMTTHDNGRFEILPFVTVCSPFGDGEIVERLVELICVD